MSIHHLPILISTIGLAAPRNIGSERWVSQVLTLVSAAEQGTHFVIGGGGKVAVPQPDAVKRLRRCQADDAVGNASHLVTCLPGSHRDRNDDRSWLKFPERDAGGPHGGACWDALVHHYLVQPGYCCA